MIKPKRQQFIEKKLKENGNVFVAELKDLLQCSEETIRRDIREMEEQGKLIRIHGGAYLPEKFDKGVPFVLREGMYEQEKEDMAGIAVSMIKNNSVVFLDSSSTCLHLAQRIRDSGKIVTLITNSLRICNVFSQKKSDVNLICLGGRFHQETSSFTGYTATEAISHNFADIAFISCPAIHIERGLSDNNINESEIRKSMLNNAHQRVLVVDHTKLGSISDILFYPLDNIHKIITDKELNPEWCEYCKKSSIEVHYA